MMQVVRACFCNPHLSLFNDNGKNNTNGNGNGSGSGDGSEGEGEGEGVEGGGEGEGQVDRVGDFVAALRELVEGLDRADGLGQSVSQSVTCAVFRFLKIL